MAWAVVLVAVVGVAAALLVTNVADDALGRRGAGDIKVDAAVMATTRTRLAEVARQLDDVSRVSGTSAAPAKITGCYTDSGDLFQPSAGRGWDVPGRADPAKIAPMIVSRLIGGGWSVGARDQFGVRTLSKRMTGWTASGSLFEVDRDDYPGGNADDMNGVYAEVRVVDAAPCRS